MSEHVIPVLRSKRAEISGHILDLEKRIARVRADLANIDAAIRILSPGSEPGAIPPKRAYKRTKYFARNELGRMALDIMRKAQGPITAGEIAMGAIRDKGLPSSAKEAVTEMVLGTLRGLVRRGTAVKTGTSRDARWAIT